ncbi:MAG: IS1096 element passenger TnpR family protein [Planctomycetales bacterium]
MSGRHRHSYQDFLNAIADPEHEEHEAFLESCGGSFSPDVFDPKEATSEMKRGLPD